MTKEEKKGKRPIKHDCVEGSTKNKKVKKPKLSTKPLLQIVEHTHSIIDSQSIIQSYTELKEKEIKQGKMKDTQSPQFFSALNKDTQLMKIAMIQTPKAGDMPNEKITKFKLNLGQFSVVDKIDLFKQTSEIICSDLISTFVSKDKLQRDFKRLENCYIVKSHFHLERRTNWLNSTFSVQN